MQEEFHGNGINGEGAQRKLLYGWGTLNVNVWLPSLCELVGYDIDTYSSTFGTCKSAMQGLNTSNNYWTDTKGGEQFAYFKYYNTSGGGERIWNVCNQQQSWLRSPDLGRYDTAWRITNATAFNTMLATDFHAVHPVVGANSVSLAYPQKAGEKLAHFIAPPLHKKARLLRLLACKRAPNASAALPPFCGKRAYWK